jgi:hypothetical protein
MNTIGNDDSGFSVSYDATNAQVRVVGWGFWSADVASSFDGSVLSEYRNAPAQSNVLIDVSGLRPMREEAQRAFVAAFGALKAAGAAHISVVTTSHLTKLQFMRIASESGTADRVRVI